VEKRKEENGYAIYISNNEMKTAYKALGLLGASLVVIRLVRFLVRK